MLLVMHMKSNSLVCDILNYIDSNINKEITINELSIIFFFDKTYIMKRFKKELGITIHEYINISRIYNSLSCFDKDTYFLSIAIKNGFNSLEYFSETFKKIMGVSPTIYKKFVLRNIDVSLESSSTIFRNISSITKTKSKISKYLSNKVPNTPPVKKISLFM